MTEFPLDKYKNLIVYSPHYDDAFLSLGGYLSHCNEVKSITIIIIYGNSNYIFGKQVQLSESKNASTIRFEEEYKNCQTIKAELIVWKNDEALMRGYSPNELFSFQENEQLDYHITDIEKQIDIVINENNDNTLHIFPLAVGNHIDHFVVNRIGKKLYNLNNSSIAFYEEQPYVARFNIDKKLIETYEPIILPTKIRQKVVCIANYKSQNAINWLSEILKYMLFITNNEGSYIERIWV